MEKYRIVERKHLSYDCSRLSIDYQVEILTHFLWFTYWKPLTQPGFCDPDGGSDSDEVIVFKTVEDAEFAIKKLQEGNIPGASISTVIAEY